MAESSEQESIPYPKAAFFFYFTQAFERFGAFAVQPILTTYFTQYLHTSEKTAKLIYHFTLMMGSFLPIFGAYLADVYVNKYNMTVLASFLYFFGAMALTFSAVPDIAWMNGVTITVFSLVVFSWGKAWSKTPMLTLGGDQFKLPMQRSKMLAFFSWMYMITNVLAVFSMAASPYLRSQPCFGHDQCYCMAFGMAALSLLAALVTVTVGKKWYYIPKPSQNMVGDAVKCMTYAVKNKHKTEERKEHWLDYADEKFDKKFVYDLKSFMRIIIVFIPLPVYWALYDQQGSQWIFMARCMNGNVGWYTFLPEHTMVINPILVVLFIPLFDYAIYPLCTKLHVIRTPLQRIIVGMFLAVLCTIIAAAICFKIEENLPDMATRGNANIFFYNSNPCAFDVDVAREEEPVTSMTIDAMSHRLYKVTVKASANFQFNLSGSCIKDASYTGIIEEANNYAFQVADERMILYAEDNDRDINSLPKIRLLVSGNVPNDTIFDFLLEGQSVFQTTTYVSEMHVMPRGDIYELVCGDYRTEIELQMGGVYVILIHMNGPKDFTVSNLEITPHNTMHMAWILAQYAVLTASEILVSITFAQFTYAEAPKSMNTIISACFALTMSLGNFIIIFIDSVSSIEKSSINFVTYGVVMLLNTFLQIYIATRYHYYRGHDEPEEDRQT